MDTVTRYFVSHIGLVISCVALIKGHEFAVPLLTYVKRRCADRFTRRKLDSWIANDLPKNVLHVLLIFYYRRMNPNRRSLKKNRI